MCGFVENVSIRYLLVSVQWKEKAAIDVAVEKILGPNIAFLYSSSVLIQYSENTSYILKTGFFAILTVKIKNTPESHLRLLSYCFLNLTLREQCNNHSYLP